MSRRLKPGQRNYNFVSLVGKVYGAVMVMREAAPVDGCAMWECRCIEGHVAVYAGIHLRSTLKQKQPLRCRVCLAIKRRLSK